MRILSPWCTVFTTKSYQNLYLNVSIYQKSLVHPSDAWLRSPMSQMNLRCPGKRRPESNAEKNKKKNHGTNEPAFGI